MDKLYFVVVDGSIHVNNYQKLDAKIFKRKYPNVWLLLASTAHVLGKILLRAVDGALASPRGLLVNCQPSN